MTAAATHWATYLGHDPRIPYGARVTFRYDGNGTLAVQVQPSDPWIHCLNDGGMDDVSIAPSTPETAEHDRFGR